MKKFVILCLMTLSYSAFAQSATNTTNVPATTDCNQQELQQINNTPAPESVLDQYQTADAPPCQNIQVPMFSGKTCNANIQLSEVSDESNTHSCPQYIIYDCQSEIQTDEYFHQVDSSGDPEFH